jgi:hypothetical protein
MTSYDRGGVHPAVSEAQIDIAVLQTRYADMERRLAHIEKTLGNVEKLLTEAKGGWRVLMLIGGATGTLGAILGHFITITFKP